MTDSYNPLAIESLASSIVSHLVETPPIPLAGLERFNGAGIYAIYYIGDFSAYQLVKERNINGKWELPIYVGKAVPRGGRQGIDQPPSSNTAVWSRLRQHARSIDDAENLNIDDFYVQWLITDDIWIALGESALLWEKRPVWNAMVDGFGNHDPGAGRRQGLSPQWDTLHPGRSWAATLTQRPEGSAEAIARDAEQYLRSRHG